MLRSHSHLYLYDMMAVTFYLYEHWCNILFYALGFVQLLQQDEGKHKTEQKKTSCVGILKSNPENNETHICTHVPLPCHPVRKRKTKKKQIDFSI